jgi:hypothetical protein
VNLQNGIRTQLLIAGIGLAFLLASGASAQELSNTQFSDGPYVEAMGQTSTATGTHIEVQATSTPQQNGNDEEQSARLIWTGTVLIWIGAIGIYAGGPARRFAREIQSLRKLYIPTDV